MNDVSSQGAPKTDPRKQKRQASKKSNGAASKPPRSKDSSPYRLLIVFNSESDCPSALKVGWALGSYNRTRFAVNKKGRDEISINSKDLTTNALAAVVDILRQVPPDKSGRHIDIHLDDVSFFADPARFSGRNVSPVSQNGEVATASAYELQEPDGRGPNLSRVHALLALDANGLVDEIQHLRLAKTAPQIDNFKVYKNVLRILLGIQTFCNGRDVHEAQSFAVSDLVTRDDRARKLDNAFARSVSDMGTEDRDVIVSATLEFVEQKRLLMSSDTGDIAFRSVDLMDGLNDLYPEAMKQSSDAVKHKRSTSDDWFHQQLLALDKM